MAIIIFLILTIIYFNIFFNIYSKTRSMEGLKASLTLFILQSTSYLGNFLIGDNFFYFADNTIQFLGQLSSAIGNNFMIIIALIIVIVKYKEENSAKNKIEKRKQVEIKEKEDKENENLENFINLIEKQENINNK